MVEKITPEPQITRFGASLRVSGQPGVVGHADRDVQPVLSALIPLHPGEAQARTTVIAGTRKASLFLYALQVLETSENSFDPVATRVTENVCRAKQE